VSTDPSPPADDPLRSLLSAEERETLVRALRRYRNLLPTYLQSSRRELELIDAILSRIS